MRKCSGILGIMNAEEMKKMIQEVVGATVASAFGVMQEWTKDQFKATNEKIDFLSEKTDRRFDEVHGELVAIKDRLGHVEQNVDELKTDMKEVRKDVKSLDNRVGNLEKQHEAHYA